MRPERDTNIWTELEPMADGFVPAIKRIWQFIGTRRGVACNFACELHSAHPSLPTHYAATAIFAHNVPYLCNEWVRLDELQPA